MAFLSIAAGDVDAESPISDDLMELIKSNQDHIYSTLNDGASAAQTINTNKLESKSATGNGLDVTNNALIQGSLTVNGTINGEQFNAGENLLLMDLW